MSALNALAAAFRLQVALTRRSPGHLMILLTTPLFSVIFLSLVTHGQRPGLLVNAVLAPGLIGVWLMSLDLAASIIEEDRLGGRTELLVASLTPMSLVVFGRISVIALAGALTFVESWLVAVVGFGADIPIDRPLVFVLAVLATCFAMAGTATLLAAIFIVSRARHVFQNALTYPFYILGGVLVPVALLPGWLEPLSRVVFLSWSADLLRGSMSGDLPDPWPAWIAATVGLGAAALAGGVLLINRMVDRSRETASVTNA
ncbi:ABC transporter permease [Micromonospora sp. CPCC 205546]|uniref:ABC transporter permease n=1 Tax=Micromonospora sp. CPCC 205546 TaxID=3122397 RepID=UPI002FEEBA59